MATNGASSVRDGDDGVNTTEASLDKIKRQLASGSGRHLLQGPLLKRSETVILCLFVSSFYLLFCSVFFFFF
ncbi:hypothetical protein Hanom_Chr06g00510441 [Helianthus anomalus]